MEKESTERVRHNDGDGAGEPRALRRDIAAAEVGQDVACPAATTTATRHASAGQARAAPGWNARDRVKQAASTQHRAQHSTHAWSCIGAQHAIRRRIRHHMDTEATKMVSPLVPAPNMA